MLCHHRNKKYLKLYSLFLVINIACQVAIGLGYLLPQTSLEMERSVASVEGGFILRQVLHRAHDARLFSAAMFVLECFSLVAILVLMKFEKHGFQYESIEDRLSYRPRMWASTVTHPQQELGVWSSQTSSGARNLPMRGIGMAPKAHRNMERTESTLFQSSVYGYGSGGECPGVSRERLGHVKARPCNPTPGSARRHIDRETVSDGSESQIGGQFSVGIPDETREPKNSSSGYSVSPIIDSLTGVGVDDAGAPELDRMLDANTAGGVHRAITAARERRNQKYGYYIQKYLGDGANVLGGGGEIGIHGDQLPQPFRPS
jgi:hypothetical protein